MSHKLSIKGPNQPISQIFEYQSFSFFDNPRVWTKYGKHEPTHSLLPELTKWQIYCMLSNVIDSHDTKCIFFCLDMKELEGLMIGKMKKHQNDVKILNIPVHKSNMSWRIWDTKSKDLFSVYKFFYHFNGSLRIIGVRSMQMMNFYCRVKSSSNKKRGCGVIQASPYSPTTAKYRRTVNLLTVYVKINIRCLELNSFYKKERSWVQVLKTASL